MTPERWAQIEELFHRAAECEPKQRTGLLDEACRNDPELRRELEVLLSCDGRAGDYVQAAVRSELTAVGFPLTGQTISHYRILDGIGGGGMGLVYRAEDIKLDRQVALKFLPEDSAQDSAALGRFEREARAASALEHPNICPIYEFGEQEGQPFLVMQLLNGRTLRELLEQKKLQKKESRMESHSKAAPQEGSALELEQLIDLAIQIADGLGAAHQKGIIHRDLKPANIFVTSQGQAKILDFGLAKLASVVTEGESEQALGDDRTGGTRPRENAPLAPPDLFFSRTGVAMGTAGYMSPEQVRGEKLDARSDLFSFGLVLYEMATGQRALTGSTGPILHDAILNKMPTPARQVNPNLPSKLEDIITRALKKDREARYQLVAEMRADLQTLSQSLHRPPWQARASGVGVLLLIAGMIFWFLQHPPTSTPNLPNLKLQQLTINSAENPVTFGAISPDGQHLAYTDAKGMHIKLVGTAETLSVPQPVELTNEKVKWEILSTSWFPDSKRFVANAHPSSESGMSWSSRTSSIWIVSVLGGAPRKLRDNALAWSISPDGSSISFGTGMGKMGDRELWLMGPDGGQAHKLYQVDEKHGICCLSFFPHGQRVAYLSTDESGDSLVARDLDGGHVVTLMPPSEIKKMGPDFSFLPDGRLIYPDPCNGGVLGAGSFDFPCNYWIKRFNTRTGELVEKPRRLTNWAGFSLSNASATADSKRIAFLESSSRGLSYVADLETGGTRLVNSRRFTMEEGGDDYISDWTADSKTVILGANRNGYYSLHRQSLNSDMQDTIVSSGAGALEDAIVSPDGKWVIMAVYPGPSMPQPLMRVPITGGSPELIFLRPPSAPGFFCAKKSANLCAVVERSEDRKHMIVTAFDPIKGRGLELSRFDLDPDFNLNINSMLCSISPDGTRLAVAAGPAGPLQIRYLRDGRTQAIRAKGLNRMQNLGWAADGNGLFVSNLTTDGTEIVHLDLQGDAKVLWKSNNDNTIFGRPSPDGRHLAIYESRQSANMWTMENF